MKKALSRRRLRRFVGDVSSHTPFFGMVILLIVSWLVFSTAMYFAERGVDSSTIDSLGTALFWGIAAFSTAGIASAPVSGMAQLIGGIWIVFGSVLFFGTIVATVTGYFMRPLQRPHRKIIETIEYNLEQLEELSVEELDLLRDTVDMLIMHVEHLKQKQAGKD